VDSLWLSEELMIRSMSGAPARIKRPAQPARQTAPT
jgi:hypothetical protein